MKIVLSATGETLGKVETSLSELRKRVELTNINNPRLDCTQGKIVFFVRFFHLGVVVKHVSQLNPGEVS